MTTYNAWFPGGNIFPFQGSTIARGLRRSADGSLAERFQIPNQSAGFGVTFDMISPPFTATKPPKIAYACAQDCRLTLKDAAGWFWTAPMPAQAAMKERGWSWARFELSADQDNTGTPPTIPAQGVIQAYQFQGAQGAVHPFNLDLGYIAGRSPVAATAGDIGYFRMTCEDPGAYTLKVGDVALDGGTRRAVRYLGTLPFGLQMNGPTRAGRSATPYRGPFIAGYQSATPWVSAGNEAMVAGMLDFLAESQVQFTARSPTGVSGPFMHCFLPETWDSAELGQPNSWVWDAPDGNPTWPGWQYRAFEGVARTWDAAKRAGMQTASAKAAAICNRFLTWLSGFLAANPTALLVPAEWRPPGWSQGQPLPPSSYLDPRASYQDAHSMALCLKGAIFCARAGADAATCRTIIRRMVQALRSVQVPPGDSPMRGAFSLNPDGFVAYGFEQAEILDALALAVENQELLA